MENEVVNWASKLKDMDEDIKKFQAELDRIVIPKIEDVLFMPYSDSSPNDKIESSIDPDLPINENRSMLCKTVDVIKGIYVGDEDSAAKLQRPLLEDQVARDASQPK